MNTPEEKTLFFRQGKNNLTLQEALQSCGDALEGGIALLYSVNSCQFAKVNQDKDSYSLINSKNKSIAIDGFVDPYVFEARIFNADCELRWLHESSGKGKVSLIYEQSNLQQKIDNIWQKNSFLEYIDSLDNTYLLWGQRSNKPVEEGWQKLSSARIGLLDLPIDREITKSQRVYLKTQEYLAEIDDNGNIVIVEERLIKLEIE